MPMLSAEEFHAKYGHPRKPHSLTGARVIDNEFLVCIDCASWLANADVSGLDYHYSPEGAARRLEEIKAGERAAVADIPGGYIVAGDAVWDRDFSRSPCRCCGSDLAGERIHCVILGD